MLPHMICPFTLHFLQETACWWNSSSPPYLLHPSSLAETGNLQRKDTGVKEIREQLEEEFIKRGEVMRKKMMTMVEVKSIELEMVKIQELDYQVTTEEA